MKAKIDLRNKRALLNLARRYTDLRLIYFAMATGSGFLLNLSILSIGVIAVFHTTSLSPVGDPSPTVLGLDLLALGVGDTLAFIINEQLTVRGLAEERKGAVNWLTRLGKYQMTAFMGNMVIVGVQVSLLLAFAITPATGSIIGAAISYPITFVVSMKFVWKLNGFKLSQPSSRQ